MTEAKTLAEIGLVRANLLVLTSTALAVAGAVVEKALSIPERVAEARTNNK